VGVEDTVVEGIAIWVVLNEMDIANVLSLDLGRYLGLHLVEVPEDGLLAMKEAELATVEITPGAPNPDAAVVHFLPDLAEVVLTPPGPEVALARTPCLQEVVPEVRDTRVEVAMIFEIADHEVAHRTSSKLRNNALHYKPV
jgi:hypothetical protein